MVKNILNGKPRMWAHLDVEGFGWQQYQLVDKPKKSHHMAYIKLVRLKLRPFLETQVKAFAVIN